MKLSQYKDDFYTFSEKASDAARAAAFAGIALAWVFKKDAIPVPRLPDDLLLPTGLFALGLALDLTHYVAGSIIWGWFHRYHEKRLKNVTDDPELEHSVWLLRIINAISALKVASVMAGYVFVMIFIIRAWM